MSQPESRRNFASEATVLTSRSRGKGGQNVNKLETKVQLVFNIELSVLLSPSEKARIQEKLSGKITSEGNLITASDSERSQLLNKTKAERKLNDLIEKSLKTPRRRIKTTPTSASVAKRLSEKKHHSIKKELRKQKSDDS